MKIRGLNDTKSVAAAVYITSLTFTVAYVCTFTVVEYVNVYAAIFSVSFFIGTTSILALLYIPNVSELIDIFAEFRTFFSQRNYGTSLARLLAS